MEHINRTEQIADATPAQLREMKRSLERAMATTGDLVARRRMAREYRQIELAMDCDFGPRSAVIAMLERLYIAMLERL